MIYTAPPPGTMCSDCGCCPAELVLPDGAICLPCDVGEHKGFIAVPEVLEFQPATQPEPAAVQAAEPEPALPEIAMEKRFCACGCGTEMSESNNWDYARGHKTKGGKKKKSAPKSAPKSASDRIKPAPDVIDESPASTVALELDEQQLTRIWDSLPIEEKALAIATALTADRS